MATGEQHWSDGIRNLREIRETAGLSQRALASLIPIAYVTLRGIETGNKRYSDQLVIKIANRLGCRFRTRKDDEGLELIPRRIDNNEPYTQVWFNEWNDAMLRKACYRPLVQQVSIGLDTVIEAASFIDSKEVDEASPDFPAADEVAHEIIGLLLNKIHDPIFSSKLKKASPHTLDTLNDLEYRLNESLQQIETKKLKYQKSKQANSQD